MPVAWAQYLAERPLVDGPSTGSNRGNLSQADLTILIRGSRVDYFRAWARDEAPTLSIPTTQNVTK